MTVLTDTAYPVLIVDDSIEDRETYGRYLSQSRTLIYEVTEAETVVDGLERFAESPPACVLLDYRLPDGSGLEFLDQLAFQFPRLETTVVMLTRYGDEEVVVNALKNGATDYLSKKRITADTLCRTVHQAIEKGWLLRSLHEREQEKDRLIAELRQAAEQIKTLRGLMPICANCKSIRDDAGYWHQLEVYIRDRTGAEFSHGICPGCAKELYPELDHGPE